MFQNNENEQTNPIAGLSTRQLAAVRALVRGLSSRIVAVQLGTSRQTINRWKRQPEFAAELRRIHELRAMGRPRKSKMKPNKRVNPPMRETMNSMYDRMMKKAMRHLR